MRLQTGLARRPQRAIDHLLTDRRFVSSMELQTVVQRAPFPHDQQSKPSCVGHAWAACIEATIGERVSSVDLWEGARTLQGNAGVSEVGTRGEFAWWWLERHGWTEYQPGEDTRPESEDEDHRVGASLADAMRAHQQRRNRVKLTQTIDMRQGSDAVAAQVVAALKAGLGVVRETATTLAYQRPPHDTVLGPEVFAGEDGGHAERVAWYDAERDAFGIQGSWGQWTWCHLPDGRRAPGCCLVSREALGAAWALDVVQVVAER